MKILGYEFKVTKSPSVSAEVAPGSTTISSLFDSFYGGAGFNRSILLGGQQRILTRDLAVSYSIVYRCVSLIAGTIASLPLQVLDRRTLQPVEPSDSPAGRVADLFMSGLSKETTNFVFLETMILDTLLEGNSFIRIHRDSSGRLEELELSIPTNTQIQRASNRMLVYGLYFDDGVYRFYPYDEVIHIMMPRMYRRLIGQGHNIHRNYGVAPAQAVAGAVAIGLMGDEHVADYFNGNDIRSSVIISLDGDINTDQQRDQLDAHIDKFLKGRRPLTLPKIKVTPLKTNAQSGELKALREFQVDEVARAYGVPPPLAGIQTSQWGSGIEQLVRLFVRSCINAHLKRIESSFSDKLLPRGFIAKFDVAELVRGDLATSGGFLRSVLGGQGVQGVVTPNEGRKQYLGLPEMDGGDTLAMAILPEKEKDEVDEKSNKKTISK